MGQFILHTTFQHILHLEENVGELNHICGQKSKTGNCRQLNWTSHQSWPFFCHFSLFVSTIAHLFIEKALSRFSLSLLAAWPPFLICLWDMDGGWRWWKTCCRERKEELYKQVTLMQCFTFFTLVHENLVQSVLVLRWFLVTCTYMLQRKVGLGLYKQDTATLTHRFIHFSNSNNVIVFRV